MSDNAAKFVDVGTDLTFRIEGGKITWSSTPDMHYHKSAISVVKFHEAKAWARFEELRQLREALEEQERALISQTIDGLLTRE